MHTIAARCAASATQSRSGDPSHMCDSLLIKQSHMCDRNSITHVCDIGSHMCDACVMHHTRQRRVTHCVTHVVRWHSARSPAHLWRARLTGTLHPPTPPSRSMMTRPDRYDGRLRSYEATSSSVSTGVPSRRPRMEPTCLREPMYRRPLSPFPGACPPHH